MRTRTPNSTKNLEKRKAIARFRSKICALCTTGFYWPHGQELPFCVRGLWRAIARAAAWPLLGLLPALGGAAPRRHRRLLRHLHGTTAREPAPDGAFRTVAGFVPQLRG